MEINVKEIIRLVRFNLKTIEKNIETDYDVFCSPELWNAVLKKFDKKDHLKILMMFIVPRPTLDELKNWNKNDLICYLQETDDLMLLNFVEDF